MDRLEESLATEETRLAGIEAELNAVELQRANLEALKQVSLQSIASKQNAIVLNKEDRSVEEFAARLAEIYDPQGWGSNDYKALIAWGRTIDPAFTYRGDGISADDNLMFPVFEINIPEVLTDDFVRNVSFLAKVVSTIHSARVTIAKEIVSDYQQTPALDFVGIDGSMVIEKTGYWSRTKTTPEPLFTALKRLS